MELTVLTYNIRGDFWTEEATKNLADTVRDKNIDILCLQEVTRHFNDITAKNQDIVSQLGSLLHGEFKSIVYLPVQTSKFSMGTAILYRTSKLIARGLPFNKHFAPRSARSRTEEWADRYFPPIRKVIMSELFTIEGRKLIIYNVHLDFWGGDVRRILQLDHMFKLWGKHHANPDTMQIIAGDFNSWMPYLILRMYRRFSALRRWLLSKNIKEASENIWWTHNFDNIEAENYEQKGVIRFGIIETFLGLIDKSFRQKEDYVWYGGKGLGLERCERLDLNWSDHFPVLAKFTIAESKNANVETSLSQEGGSGIITEH